MIDTDEAKLIDPECYVISDGEAVPAHVDKVIGSRVILSIPSKSDSKSGELQIHRLADCGKTFFITRDKAEKALAERSKQ